MDLLRNSPGFAMQIARITLVAAMVFCGMVSEARAALVFCNRTQQPIEAALGHREHNDDDAGDVWISEGWWRIEPGQCSRVYGQPLTERFYFYHATALAPSAPGKKPFIWQGKYQFCTDAKAFKIEGDGDCEGRGYRVKGFQQIDLGPNTRDYTLDFKDNG
jgi:uncharacterized membrane protein